MSVLRIIKRQQSIGFMLVIITERLVCIERP